EVRRHYIGERFDVGHLLDHRKPASISHHGSTAPAHPPALAGMPDAPPALPGPLVTTEWIVGRVDQSCVQTTHTQSSSELPPPPPYPDGPTPGVYEEPDF